MHSMKLILLLLAGSLAAGAQTTAATATGQKAGSEPAVAPAAAQVTTSAAQDEIVVPAGTRVLLELRSAINTKSARPGDGVYLSSIFPVVAGNRVVIPAGVYVQGVVDRVVRPGRVRGRAELNMHFTSIIFPNGSVVEVPGMVNSLPGAKNQKVKDGEGTIEQDGGGNKGRNAAETAKVAVPTGATIGSIGGLESGHPLAGGLEGAAAGLAAAGIVALFTHKAEVNIPAGTQVEMELQRPLILQKSNLQGPVTLSPASVQPSRRLAGPTLQRPQMLCPAGSLGCS